MSTHPTILGEMLRQEAEDSPETSLEVGRDLAIPAKDGEAAQADPARGTADPARGTAELPDDAPAGGTGKRPGGA